MNMNDEYMQDKKTSEYQITTPEKNITTRLNGNLNMES